MFVYCSNWPTVGLLQYLILLITKSKRCVIHKDRLPHCVMTIEIPLFHSCVQSVVSAHTSHQPLQTNRIEMNDKFKMKMREKKFKLCSGIKWAGSASLIICRHMQPQAMVASQLSACVSRQLDRSTRKSPKKQAKWLRNLAFLCVRFKLS